LLVSLAGFARAAASVDSSTANIGSAGITEGNSGTQNLAFKVSLSKPSNNDVKLDWATSDGAGVFPSLLFEDNFDYAAGTNLFGQGGWTVYNDGLINPLHVSSGNLSYSGYGSSGIGNLVGQTTIGEDGSHGFAGQSSGNLYAAMLVVVQQSWAAPGDYFFHLIDGPVSNNAFHGRIWVKQSGAGSNYTIGVQFAGTGNPNYVPGFPFVVGSTHLLVVKYLFFPGFANDQIAVFIDPLLNTFQEPSPTLVVANSGSDLDATNLDGVAIRQGAPQLAPVIVLDGMRVATSWGSAVGTSGSPLAATAADHDYVPATGSLMIAAGQTSGLITVSVNGDTKFEGDESFSVDLTGAGGAAIGEGHAAGTIVNDDGPPTLSIGDVKVIEGNSGTVNAVFTISLSGPTAQIARVNYLTADNTATVANNDYIASGGTVEIPPGETSATLTVLVNGDLAFELTEAFSVNLSSPANASIADGQGVGSISNDDPGPSVSIADAAPSTEGNSGSKASKFPVTLSNASGVMVVVRYQTMDGSATAANADFTAKTDSLKLLPGTVSDTIRINVVGDTKLEDDETFFVNITSVTGGTIAGTGTAQTTILNDDGIPQIQVTSGGTGAQGKNEGNSGKVAFPIQLSLVGANALATVECDWHTADGTATLAGNDYQAASGHATWAPKATTTTITVFINGDIAHETWETIAIVCENPVNATLRDFGFGPGVGHVSIADDDPEPLISIGDPVVREGNDGETPCAFSISLSRPNGVAAVSVHWTTVDDLALGGNSPDGDFTRGSGLVTFDPGQTQAVVTIDVHGDTEVEPDETFQVLLTQPQHGTIQDNTGVGTIVDDDGVVGVPPGEAIKSFALGRVTPNPSRYGQPVTIEYALPKAASIRVSVLDVQGREVAVLANGMTRSGRYRVTWYGDHAPAGLYFVRYQFPVGKAQVQRLALKR
jgi:hypothetical protein